MKHFRTILKFEYLTYVQSKVFLVMTALVLAAVILLGNIPNFAGIFSMIAQGTGIGQSADGGAAESEEKAAIYDPAGIYTDDILQEYAPQYIWVRLDESGAAAVRQSVESGEYAFALSVDGLNYTVTEPGTDLLGGAATSAMIDEMVLYTYQSDALRQAGLSGDAVRDILNAAPAAEYISVGKDITQTYWIGYALLMILYMAVLLYGQYIMMSVITEKTSKAMELLITSTKPVYLIFGKVIGVGLAGLTQFVLLIGTVIATLGLTKDAWASFAPSVAAVLSLSTNLSTFLYAIVFFLLGFFTFAFIYAGFASTISRVEEANSIAMFPIFLFVGAFLVSISALTSASAGYVTVCSFVPFLSPLVMFTRICVTDVPVIQILISIVINIATIFTVGILSAKIYRTGVMLYGKTPKIKDIFKYMIKA